MQEAGGVATSCQSEHVRSICGGVEVQRSARIRYLQLDTRHFFGGIARRINALEREELAPLVAASTSVAQVAVALGLPDEGRAHRDLDKRMAALSLDTRHFRGRGWSRGETRESHPSVDHMFRKRELSDAEVFIENAPPTNGTRLTKRLLKMGIRYECACCGITEWRRTPIVLHLDHINDINNDNRIENLRLLCPNCHSQTDTYGNRASRASRASEPIVVLYGARSRAWRNW